MAWELKRLDEIFDIQRGGSPRPISSFITSDKNGINWIKIGDATNSGKYIYTTEEKIRPEGLSKTRLVKKGDFLLSNSMSFGRPYILKTSGAIHDGWLVLRERVNLDKNFFYYLLSSPLVYNQFDRLAAGATVRNLNTKLVSNVLVPVPEIKEQYRIVKILDGAFEKIDIAKVNLKKNIQNSKELFESFLQGTFQKRGENWEIKKIGEICGLMTGGTPSRSKNDYFGGDIKWLVSGDVHKGEIFDCEGRITKLGLKNSNARYLPVNSVIIALNGQGKTRGAVALLRTKATCNQSLVSIYPKAESTILSEYIYFNLKSRYKEIRKITGDAGNERRGLNMPLIRNIEISYPVSLKEQIKLVKKFNCLMIETKRLTDIYKDKLSSLEELQKSILNKAFSGEL